MLVTYQFRFCFQIIHVVDVREEHWGNEKPWQALTFWWMADVRLA